MKSEYHLTIGFMDRESAIVKVKAHDNLSAIIQGSEIASREFSNEITRVKITYIEPTRVLPQDELSLFMEIPYVVSNKYINHHMLIN